MNSKEMQEIFRQTKLLYPDFLNIQTEYNLDIENTTIELKSTTNVFRENLPENIVLLRLAYDLSLIKILTTNFINNNENIKKYEPSINHSFSLSFQINNSKVTVLLKNVKSINNTTRAFVYKEFFNSLKQYLFKLSLEGEYKELERINNYIDKIQMQNTTDFYSFINDNIDLYAKFISVNEKDIIIQSTSIPILDNNYNQYNRNNYSQQALNNNSIPYYMRKSNGMCIASFVLGMISIFFWWSIIPPILAFAFGIVGIKNFDTNHEKNKSLGYIGFSFGAFYLFLIVILIILPILSLAFS